MIPPLKKAPDNVTCAFRWLAPRRALVPENAAGSRSGGKPPAETLKNADACGKREFEVARFVVRARLVTAVLEKWVAVSVIRRTGSWVMSATVFAVATILVAGGAITLWARAWVHRGPGVLDESRVRGYGRFSEK